jgi:class 3 adenylate cyclase/tetratricopeptide (TPR) repeat protein
MAAGWTELLDRDLKRLARGDRETGCGREELAPGERREVAVLFLDMEGFTGLSESLDHETLHRIMTGLMGVLSRVVEGCGGYVDKFEGDRVMALFGASRSTGDECSRSVTCGLRMLGIVRELGEALSRAGGSIGARAGISYGAVTVAPDAGGHLTAMGDEVNVASRLEESAGSGALLVSGKVRDLCPDGFVWTDLGEVSLRGRARPVRVFRAEGFGSGRLERWQRASPLLPAPLIGRDAEMAVLSGVAAARLAGGDSNPRGSPLHRMVLVQGPAGIGKSRLAHEFLSGPEVGTLLSTRTASFDQPPWWLWTGLVRRFSERSPGGLADAVQELAGRTGAHGEALLASLPALGALMTPGAPGRPDGMTPEAWASVLDVALRNLVRAMCGGPVTLLLEDIQWADSASLDALEFILRNCEAAIPLLVTATMRSDPDEHPVLFERGMDSYVRCETVRLGPLGDPEVRLLAARKLGLPVDALPGMVEEALIPRAEGNPYFVEEILSELVARGAVSPGSSEVDEAAAASAGCMPSSVGSLIRARIDDLPSGLKSALRIAAVLGLEFPGSVFAELCRLEGLDPGDSLEGLSSLRLLRRREDPGGCVVTFPSVLARDAVYENTLFHNRAVLHARAARAIGDLEPGGYRAEIAMHLHRAGDDTAAAEKGFEAIAALVGSYQNAAALEWCDRTGSWLEGVPDGVQRERLELRLMSSRLQVLKNVGRPAEIHELTARGLEEAIRLGDPEAEAEFVLSRGSNAIRGGAYEDAMRDISRSIGLFRALGKTDREVVARNWIIQGLIQKGRIDEALAQCRENLGIAEASGSAYSVAECLSHAGMVLIQRGRLDEAEEMLLRAVEICRQTSNLVRRAITLSSLGMVAGMRGDLRKAYGYLSDSVALSAEIGSRITEGTVLNNLGNVLVALDRRDEARACWERALAIHRETGIEKSEAVSMANLGILAEDAGDLDEAASMFASAVDIQRRVGNLSMAVNAECHLARVWLRRGDDPAGALEVYDRARSEVEGAGFGRALCTPVDELRKVLVERGVPGDRIPGPSNWEVE